MKVGWKIIAFSALAMLPFVSMSWAAPEKDEHTAAIAAAHGTAHPQRSDYVVGPHDLIEVKVWDFEELDQEVRIKPDGTITMPLLGELNVGGKGQKEIENMIARLLIESGNLKKPQVTVSIREYVSRKVTVAGAVSNPGELVMLGDWTVLDLLGQAGGLNDRAGKKLHVLRPLADGTTRTIEIDVEALVYGADVSQDIRLVPGDRIVIPYLQKIRVYVMGAVQKPGPVEFPKDEIMTLLMAITSAGGTTDRANESRIEIRRRLDGGKSSTFTVNLRKIQRGKMEDVNLQRDDIVFVRESFF